MTEMSFLTPARAQLICLDDDALSFRLGDDGIQFNPESLSIERSSSVTGTSRAADAYGGMDMGEGQNDTLKFTLTLDATEDPDKDLADTLQKFYKLTLPVDDGGLVRHPVVAFQWGPTFTFQGVCSGVSFSVEMFDSKGKFKRATVTPTLSGRAFAKVELNPRKFLEAAFKPKDVKGKKGKKIDTKAFTARDNALKKAFGF